MGQALNLSKDLSLASGVRQAKLWYLQRISAMVLGICVAIHLAIIFYAIRGGLTAGEILGRTQGNWLFAIFYEIFVLACFIHAPIGLANILQEHFPRSKLSIFCAWLLAGLILILGSAAVWGLVVGGPQ